MFPEAGLAAGLDIGLDVGVLGRVIGALGRVIGVLGRVIGVLGLTFGDVGLGFTEGLGTGLEPFPEGIDGLVAGRLILLFEFVGRVDGLVAGRVAGRFVAGLTTGEDGFLYVLPS